jgi:uncharacterized membrane protein
MTYILFHMAFEEKLIVLLPFVIAYLLIRLIRSIQAEF